MNFEILAGQLEQLKNIGNIAQQLAAAKAELRNSWKKVPEGAEVSILEQAEIDLVAALKAAGGKASTYLYGKAYDLVSGKELCLYIQGNQKPAKGVIKAVWGYWEETVQLNIEQITGLLTEAEYDELYAAEDKAYNDEQAELERLAAEEKQRKADAKAAAKAKPAAPTTEGSDLPPATNEGGEGAGEAAASGAEGGAPDAVAEGGEAAPATPAAKAGNKPPRGPAPAPQAPAAAEA